MLLSAAGVLSCGWGQVQFRTARQVAIPGGRTETVYDVRTLLTGGPHRAANATTIKMALRGEWATALARWSDLLDCRSGNNAAIAAAMLGKRAEAIRRISAAAHACPDLEAIRENARLIVSDGVPIPAPAVELSDGVTDQPRPTPATKAPSAPSRK